MKRSIAKSVSGQCGSLRPALVGAQASHDSELAVTEVVAMQRHLWTWLSGNVASVAMLPRSVVVLNELFDQERSRRVTHRRIAHKLMCQHVAGTMWDPFG